MEISQLYYTYSLNNSAPLANLNLSIAGGGGEKWKVGVESFKEGRTCIGRLKRGGGGILNGWDNTPSEL